jgi:hypothetical protein
MRGRASPRETVGVIERRRLRRIFLSAFVSEGLVYEGDGCQVVHADLTWSVSLVVDGTGTHAPYRLVLGASLPQLGDETPRKAEDCYLVWPLSYDSTCTTDGVPRMPDAASPDWPGTEDARAVAIAECVAAAGRYVREVDSMEALRARYARGHYEDALIIAPMRRVLEAS